MIRLGLGFPVPDFTIDADWNALRTTAVGQGLMAVMVDGVVAMPEEKRPPRPILLQWIGDTLKMETRYTVRKKAAKKMALIFQQHHIRTYVLKGLVIAECYPNPKHRISVDMDCYLAKDVQGQNSEQGQDEDWDAWDRGNQVIEQLGFKVIRDHYKNSTFILPGLNVENHQFIVPFRGNETLKKLERLLQGYMRDDQGEDLFEKTCLCRPPVMVSALFLIEHAYTHFLHEGLTWRYVLDWMLFSRKHEAEIDWCALNALIDEFGFRKFYDAYYHLGKFLLGEIAEEELTQLEQKMMADAWAPLDIHKTPHGVRGKMDLAGNTLRAWWKYHYFTPISMPHALWIQVRGFLFDRHPVLDR